MRATVAPSLDASSRPARRRGRLVTSRTTAVARPNFRSAHAQEVLPPRYAERLGDLVELTPDVFDELVAIVGPIGAKAAVLGTVRDQRSTAALRERFEQAVRGLARALNVNPQEVHRIRMYPLLGRAN